MKAYVETYNRIKDVLESSALEFNHIGFWMRNVERHIAGGGFMFQDKSIFIEFPFSQTASDGSYHQYYFDSLTINIHVVTTCIGEDFLTSLLYAQEVHEILAHQSFNFSNDNGGFSELKLDSFTQDLATKDKYDMVFSYTTKLTDSTTRREKKLIEVNAKHVINKDIDNG